MMLHWTGVASGVCAAMLAGCPSPAGPDVSDASSDVTTDTGIVACNAVPVTAPPVTGTAGTGTQPVPMGGTIADGTYFLTAHQTYGSAPSATTYRTVLVFAGSRLDLAQTRNGGADERATLTVTTSGIQFQTHSTCPPGQSLSYDSYTATPTQITLFDVPRVVTLTRQ